LAKETETSIRARIEELRGTSQKQELIQELITLFYRIWRSFPEEAESIAWEVINTASRLQRSIDLARGYKLMGMHHYGRSRFTESMDFYLKASEIFRSHGEELENAKVLNNIGLIYMDQGLLHIALEHFKVSLRVKLEHDAQACAAFTYLNLGLIHKRLGNHTLSLQNFWEALAIWQETGDQHNIACCYNDIGALQNIMGFPKKALKMHQSALAIRARSGDIKGRAISIGNIAGILAKNGDYDGALSHYMQSLKLQEQIEDNSNIANTHANIGELLTSMERYDEALQHIETGLEMSRDLHLQSLEAECIEHLSTLKERTGDLQGALDCYKEHIRLQELIQERQLSDKTEEFQKMIQNSIRYPVEG